MPDIADLKKIDGLSDVANNLINKISEAIGWRTTSSSKRIAKETFIYEVKNSDLAPIEKAALISSAGKIIKEYSNQSNIVKKAIPLLSSEANPDSIEEDWISFFMDKARLISDEEFQLIWAKILAEETNAPGTISVRTVDTLKNLSKKEALMFQKFAKRAVYAGNQAYIFTKWKGLDEDFGEILEMEDSGLLSSQLVTSTHIISDQKEGFVFHDKRTCCMMKSKAGTAQFKFSGYVFTKAGYELLQAIDVEHEDNLLLDYLKTIKNQYEDKIIIRLYKVNQITESTINYRKDVDLLHDSCIVVSENEENK